MFHCELLIGLNFLRISKVWSMLHHMSVGRVQNKKCYFMFTYTFLLLLLLFYIKKFVFLSFSFFFFFFFLMEYQIFRILTKQKLEMVIRNCQWNCTLGNIFKQIFTVRLCLKNIAFANKEKWFVFDFQIVYFSTLSM